jgi:hypothetical protein
MCDSGHCGAAGKFKLHSRYAIKSLLKSVDRLESLSQPLGPTKSILKTGSAPSPINQKSTAFPVQYDPMYLASRSSTEDGV